MGGSSVLDLTGGGCSPLSLQGLECEERLTHGAGSDSWLGSQLGLSTGVPLFFSMWPGVPITWRLGSKREEGEAARHLKA